MMIKFPLKLLIWKPFKVNLGFIETVLSCINLETIQKQSDQIQKLLGLTNNPARMIPVRYVSFFFRDVHLVLFHQHQLALVSFDS